MNKLITKLKHTTGQAMLGTILMSSIVGGTSTWLLSHILNSPTQLAAAIDSIKGTVGTQTTAIAVHETRLGTDEKDITDLKKKVDVIYEIVLQMGQKQGINIKQ